MSRCIRLACLSWMMWATVAAELIFYDQAAGIEIKSTATLEIGTTALKPIDGTIIKSAGGRIIGNKFYFKNGIFSDGDFDVLLTATYDPNKTFSIELNGTTGGGSSFYFVNNPGFIPQRISFRGFNNRFEGLPSFVNNISLNLADYNTTVTFALQRELNQHVILNGGTIVFDDDLIFDDFIKLQGTGRVFFNGNNLILGTKQLIWTDTLRFFRAQNFILNGASRLNSRWTFDGDSHMVGNNNIFELGTGGKIFVKKNTTLKMSNVRLFGLGKGSIEFEDKTSRLELFECRLDLENDYTFTTGGVYVSGESTAVTRGHLLKFDLLSSLTVDGTSLFYDTLDFKDLDNIRTFTERGTNNYGFVNGGSVRYKSSNKIGDENFNGDTFLDRTITINKKRRIIVNNHSEIDGRTQSIMFARAASEPIVIVKSGKRLKFKNVLLSDFPLAYSELQLGSQIIFGNDTTIELGENAIFDKVMEFEGNVFFNGKNKTIVMAPSAQFVFRPGASVLFDNLKIKGITGSSFVMFDNTCTVSFGDVEWTQDASYTFSHGNFDVLGWFSLNGTSTFAMSTAEPCTVYPLGTIQLNRGSTFLYAPSVDNRDALAFVDHNATLFLNGGTLASTTTGLRLTKGTLVADSKSYLRNDGATSLSEAIAIGDGLVADDFSIKIEPAATLELLSGILTYDNAV